MKIRVLGLLTLVTLIGGRTTEGQKLQDKPYNPRESLGIAIEGSWASPDIIAGLLANQTVVATSVDLDVTLHQGRRARYRWEFELIPLYLSGDLRQVDEDTITIPGQAPTYQYYDALVAFPCPDRSYTGPNYVIVNGIAVQDGTITSTQVCSRRWTYAGGVSPLGQRFNFRPERRVQPYVVLNAGFVMATRNIPLSDATRFNFTAEGGGGVEVFRSAKASVAFDVRYHHMSNGGRGSENPGVENWMFRLAYRMGKK
jgi:hypothetical protein